MSEDMCVMAIVRSASAALHRQKQHPAQNVLSMHEMKLTCEEEGVMSIPRRMLLRLEQCIKIPETAFSIHLSGPNLYTYYQETG